MARSIFDRPSAGMAVPNASSYGLTRPSAGMARPAGDWRSWPNFDYTKYPPAQRFDPLAAVAPHPVLGGPETDPYLRKLFGDQFTSLFEPDERYLQGVRQRGIADAGARERAALTGLSARGGDRLPGGYGVASLLAQLGGQSDLSRNLNEAYMGEQGRSRTAREGYYGSLMDFFRDQELARQQYMFSRGLLSDKNEAERKRGGKGISLGFGPASVSFADGGVVEEPTRALIGDEGPEAVVPTFVLRAGPAATLEWLNGQGAFRAATRPRNDMMYRYGEGGELGGFDPMADDEGFPESPAPYAAPDKYQPQGFLEKLGAIGRNVKIDMGQNAPGVAKLLALIAGGTAAVGDEKLKEQEGVRASATARVAELNKRQELGYKTRLASYLAKSTAQAKSENPTESAADRARNIPYKINGKTHMVNPTEYAALTRGTGDQENVDIIADEIEAGRQPPDTKGFYRMQVPIRAALGRRGYDLARAYKDWLAVTTHIRTLNGRLQTQIRQSANTVGPALEYIDQLNEELKRLVPRTEIAKLSKLSIGAARDWAVFGPRAQAAAQELTTLLADVAPELANIYQAGGVPTDHAMELAQKAMNAEMAPNNLSAALKVTGQQLKYRLNSIRSTPALSDIGPVGEDYRGEVHSTTPTSGAGTVLMRAPNGQTKEVPADKVPFYKSKGATVVRDITGQ